MNQTIILCDRIERANLSSIKSINNNVVTFYLGFDFEIMDNLSSAVFMQDGKTSAPGLLVDQKLTVSGNIEINQHADLIQQPQLFKLRTSIGEILLWGSKDNPVLCTSNSREISKTKYTFNRQSTKYIV